MVRFIFAGDQIGEVRLVAGVCCRVQRRSGLNKKSLANPIARIFNPNPMKTNMDSETDAADLFNLESAQP